MKRTIGTYRAGTGLVTSTAAALALVAALGGGTGQAAAASHGAAAAGTITTLAGGPGGPGKATTIGMNPCGVAASPGGGFYIADDPAVRQVSTSDQLTSPAGAGVFTGPPDSGEPATAANLRTCDVRSGPGGLLAIAESNQRQVSVVPAKSGTFYGQAMTAGHIYTVAGNGQAGFGTNGELALDSPMNDAEGLAVDSHGNLIIPELGHGLTFVTWSRVRVVAASTGTFYGMAMTAGHMYTVAGGGSKAHTSGDGGPGPQASLGLDIGGVAVDQAGNLVIADAQYCTIRVLAGRTGTFYGQAMKAGDIYTIAGTGQKSFGGDGGPALKASFFYPADVTVDPAGDLFIADLINNRVRVLAAASGTLYGQTVKAGDVYTVAGDGKSGFSGDGGPATKAKLGSAKAVAVDSAGNLLIADFSNGLVRMVAGQAGTSYGQKVTAGDIYTVAGIPGLNGDLYSGDGGPALRAQITNPGGMSVDPAGDMLIADTDNDRIRMVPTTSGTFFGQAMTAGDMYTVAGDGAITGFSGDGGPAVKAGLNTPGDVVMDPAGNLVIADSNSNRIRVVAAKSGTFYGQAMTAGDIYTIAGDGSLQYSGDGGPATSAGLGEPEFAVLDRSGNVLISDQFSNRIRVVAESTGTFYDVSMTAGDIYTIAGDGTAGFAGDGGPATSAEFDSPEGSAVDPAGNILIADLFNERVRVLAAKTGTFYGQAMTAGDIYTIAGTGTTGFAGDGGPATSAELHWPENVTLDRSGNLILSDADNHRIRVIAASAGTFYGVSMTAGDIYTVAGTGTDGFSGDGGPATSADLDFPVGLVATTHGLLFTDDRRVRMISG